MLECQTRARNFFFRDILAPEAKLFFSFLLRRISICSPGCFGTRSLDQAGLQLRDLPVSAPCSGIKGIYHHACLGKP